MLDKQKLKKVLEYFLELHNISHFDFYHRDSIRTHAEIMSDLKSILEYLNTEEKKNLSADGLTKEDMSRIASGFSEYLKDPKIKDFFMNSTVPYRGDNIN